jgi:16S rRNA processing protein RimM
VDVGRLKELDELFIAGYGPAKIRELNVTPAGVLVHLEGVRDRDAAAALVNAQVFAPRAALPLRPEAALEGASVILRGEVVGEVVEVVLGGVNELLRVRTAGGDALLPLSAPYVRVEGGGPDDARVVLEDPPDGLLEPT